MKPPGFCVWVVAFILAAAGESLGAPVQTVFSTTRRFVVTGLPAADAATLARWAEDVAQRVEAATGTALPFADAEYIAIKALDDATALRSRVSRAQGFLDGRLQQKLVMLRPAGADQEDMLEGLCWLLLNREVIQRQSGVQRGHALGHVPDWLAVGLAQNLFKELRARNTRAVLDLNAQGLTYSMGKIVDLNSLPEGRWREKYFCGVAVSWFLSLPNSADRWQRVFTKLARGEIIDAAWLAGAGLALADATALEPAWQNWILQQKDIVFDFSTLERDRIDALALLLKIMPEEYGGGPEGDSTEAFTPADLIAARKENWAKNVSAGVAMRARLLGLGQSPEFQSVLQGYIDLFVAISGKGGRRSEKTLTAMLRKADASRASFQSRRDKEEHYVNTVSRWLDMNSAVARTPDGSNVLPSRAAVEEYMDEVDRSLIEP